MYIYIYIWPYIYILDRYICPYIYVYIHISPYIRRPPKASCVLEHSTQPSNLETLKPKTLNPQT